MAQTTLTTVRCIDVAVLFERKWRHELQHSMTPTRSAPDDEGRGCAALSGTRMIALFLSLIRLVMADGTACHGAEHSMMSGVVARDPAHHGALQTAFCVCWTRRQQEQGHQERGETSHGIDLVVEHGKAFT
jgi:hypothetical protein